MTIFRPGRELAGDFYRQAVRPILDSAFPGLEHSAGLLGPGSEVLGYDTERSTDHDWGLRLQLFVASEQDSGAIRATLAERLPQRFGGYSTRPGTGLPGEVELGAVEHLVEVHEPQAVFVALLGFDPNRGVRLEDWLLTPSQLLLSVTAGAVFHDGLDVLRRAQEALGWYPQDVWLHLLACQWRRIGQEEAFVGRSGEVGDDLGSRLLAGRLVRDLMRLCFLLERHHAPYGKWFGTAFRELQAAAELGPILEQALQAADWRVRETELAAGCAAVARRQNALGLTQPVDPAPRRFHGRPFNVLDAGRFAAACREAIADPRVARLGWLGSVDQFADSTDLLSNVALIRRGGSAWLG